MAHCDATLWQETVVVRGCGIIYNHRQRDILRESFAWMGVLDQGILNRGPLFRFSELPAWQLAGRQGDRYDAARKKRASTVLL